MDASRYEIGNAIFRTQNLKSEFVTENENRENSIFKRIIGRFYHDEHNHSGFGGIGEDVSVEPS